LVPGSSPAEIVKPTVDFECSADLGKKFEGGKTANGFPTYPEGEVGEKSKRKGMR